MKEEKPREEMILEEVYGEAEFVVSRSPSKAPAIMATEKVSNDWASRLPRAIESLPQPCVMWSKEDGYGQVSGFALPNTPLAMKRGRGRPRKYPLPVISDNVKPLNVSRQQEIILPYNYILSGQLPDWRGSEYDADEQDMIWLEQVSSCIDIDQFELIFECLELEWFQLTKSIQRKQAQLEEAVYPEQISCQVCRREEGPSDSNNMMVLCDGCDLAVHQECYGITNIPEGPWLCRACGEASRCGQSEVEAGAPFIAPPACCLCPWPGGALKPTTDGRWAHLLCAQWVPGASILNHSLLEPIDVAGVSPERFRLACYLCQSCFGAPLQCDYPKCHIPFHPYCASRAGLTMKPASATDDKTENDGKFEKGYGKRRTVRLEKIALCGKHGPVDLKFRIPKAFLIKSLDPSQHIQEHEDRDDDNVDIESDYCFPINPKRSNNDALVHVQPLTRKRQVFKRLESIAPRAILEKISKDLKIDIEQVSLVARYWSLKRADRENFPLIKRLQVDPWVIGGRFQNDPQLLHTISCLSREAQSLLEIARIKDEIERMKLHVAVCIREMISLVTEPLKYLIQSIEYHSSQSDTLKHLNDIDELCRDAPEKYHKALKRCKERYGFLDRKSVLHSHMSLIVECLEFGSKRRGSIALDRFMDDFVWLQTKKGYVAGRVYEPDDFSVLVPENIRRQCVDKSLMVHTFSKKRKWTCAQPNQIFIMSDDYGADTARLHPLPLDKSSFLQAQNDRKNKS